MSLKPLTCWRVWFEPNQTLPDLVDRHRIEVVQLLPSSPQGDDEIGLFQDRQMLADRLTRHVEARAEFVKRLATVGAQAIKKFSPTRVGQCFEHSIHSDNMQPFGCMSTRAIGTRAAERRCWRHACQIHQYRPQAAEWFALTRWALARHHCG